MDASIVGFELKVLSCFSTLCIIYQVICLKERFSLVDIIQLINKAFKVEIKVFEHLAYYLTRA
jgi:hypothetical protein